MTLFGINVAGIFTAVLEYFGAKRRHRKELQREGDRRALEQQAENRLKEQGRVQEASRADDTIVPVPDGMRDPHDEA